MSEIIIFIFAYVVYPLFYGGMIWFLIYICFSLATESKTEWLRNLWSWIDSKSEIWHLVIAYAIGCVYLVFYFKQ